MKVLITGGLGYLGKVIAKFLINHEVKIVDLKDGKDYRDIKDKDLQKGMFVVHLAAIVGDQACKQRPKEARETNYKGLKKFIERCKYKQVSRFIFASTCSIYGEDSASYCYENSRINPLSLYATSKFAAERTILSSANESFHPTILRFGTAFGWSEAMRYNLALNLFAKKIKHKSKITIFGGNQFRPFIHTTDIARIIKKLIEFPGNYFREVCSGEIFNIASENMCMKYLGYNLIKWFPNINIEFDNTVTDKRSYKVNTTKASTLLGFRPQVSIKEGIIEMINKI